MKRTGSSVQLMADPLPLPIPLAIFVAASLPGGLAHTPAILIAARVLQGMGAALAGPSVLALVMKMARDDADRAKGMSLFIAVSSIGASAGLILGGMLTEFLSWRWSLLINVPVGAIVMAMIGRLVSETRPKAAKLDVLGAVTATAGSAALVYGFISAAENGWLESGTIPSFVAAAVLFVIFFRTEKAHAAPVMDLSLLEDHAPWRPCRDGTDCWDALLHHLPTSPVSPTGARLVPVAHRPRLSPAHGDSLRDHAFRSKAHGHVRRRWNVDHRQHARRCQPGRICPAR
jgi:hypothetical protein